MSRQQSLEQKRAATAWRYIEAIQQIQSVKPGEYKQLARSAPADIQINGLGQTLAFLQAKGSKDGKPTHNASWKLQEHLSEWVMQQLSVNHPKSLMGWIMDEHTTSQQYRLATAEAIAFLSWLKRFAEAALGD